ncbi:iron ABC transporter substrate-binding protein [Aurantiacibacter aquimixticola]|uniref:Iron ABC transporter substrate-binding protein n=1 Tax=Aurantiacibacter aquimixticola TaxID=1958945 RepID=A0A419RWQ0_9SPHN|nr:iron ABC transporter substrate-binding protein [Aurantiacibacter aquimixticola]
MALAGCGGDGEERAASHRPTIVSLNPCADAILAEIAAPGQLLAISHYSHDPAASSMQPSDARRYASTGGTVEEILALSPDVVVADSFLSPATASALERADVRVERLGIAGSLEDSLAQIRQLAELTGEAERGEALAGRIESAWHAASADGEPVPTLLWQQGGIVAGEGSLAFAMLEQAGFASHSAARGMGQGAYLPLEQVLADPPQLVLAAGDERALSHPALKTLDDIRYETFDSALLYCGGPTIPRALARLREIRRSMENDTTLARAEGR